MRFADVDGCEALLAELKDVVEVFTSGECIAVMLLSAKKTAGGRSHESLAVHWQLSALQGPGLTLVMLCSICATLSASRPWARVHPRASCWRASLAQVCLPLMHWTGSSLLAMAKCQYEHGHSCGCWLSCQHQATSLRQGADHLLLSVHARGCSLVRLSRHAISSKLPHPARV